MVQTARQRRSDKNHDYSIWRLVPVPRPPNVVNPFTVPIQPNRRLILDLRCINKEFFYDLKSSYHHTEIYPDHLRFLGSELRFPGESAIQHFVFCFLPFGLYSALYIFTQCLKQLEKYWWFNNVNNYASFLDDCWLIHSDRDTRAVLATSIWSDLRKSGFITYDEKSQWCQTQFREWLGIIWNVINGTITISER